MIFAKFQDMLCIIYCSWVQGSKSLTLNHVVNILLTLNRTNDWVQALTRNIPKRKFNSE